MSQMFKKYIKGNTDIPDNELKFLPVKPEFKDVLVLNSDNDHTFQLSPSKSEMEKIEITYKQGTNTVLTKTYIMDLFYQVTNDIGDAGQWIYPDHTASLYVFTPEELQERYDRSIESLHQDIYKSILFYSLNPAETCLFNDYNTDLVVQCKVTYVDGCVDFSDIYKLKLIPTIEPKEEN